MPWRVGRRLKVRCRIRNPFVPWWFGRAVLLRRPEIWAAEHRSPTNSTRIFKGDGGRLSFSMGRRPHRNRAVICYYIPYEYIVDHRGSASLVRWWRVLFWRSRHRRQRAWPDSADMPDYLFGWRIPRLKKLTGWRLPCPEAVAQQAGRHGLWP